MIRMQNLKPHYIYYVNSRIRQYDKPNSIETISRILEANYFCKSFYCSTFYLHVVDVFNIFKSLQFSLKHFQIEFSLDTFMCLVSVFSTQHTYVQIYLLEFNLLERLSFHMILYFCQIQNHIRQKTQKSDSSNNLYA